MARLQNAGDVLQEPIAHQMPMRIVDALEAIQVHDQHTEAAAVPSGTGQFPVQAPGELPVVQQAGEAVADRHLPQFVLALLQHISHRVEGGCHLANFVRTRHRDAIAQVAGTQSQGPCLEGTQGSDDGAHEHQAREHGDDERHDEQYPHQAHQLLVVVDGGDHLGEDKAVDPVVEGPQRRAAVAHAGGDLRIGSLFLRGRECAVKDADTERIDVLPAVMCFAQSRRGVSADRALQPCEGVLDGGAHLRVLLRRETPVNQVSPDCALGALQLALQLADWHGPVVDLLDNQARGLQVLQEIEVAGQRQQHQRQHDNPGAERKAGTQGPAQESVGMGHRLETRRAADYSTGTLMLRARVTGGAGRACLSVCQLRMSK